MDLKSGTICITVWGEDWCDEPFEITDSHGFSLDRLNEINEQFLESDYDWSQYYESDIIINLTYSEPQIGNYPPPNIEVEGYWDWDVLEQIPFEYPDEESFPFPEDFLNTLFYVED